MAIVQARTRIDPDDPIEIPLAPTIDWYRVDATRQIVASLAIGATAMTVGMFAAAGLVLGHGTTAIVAGIGGMFVVIGGGAASVLGTARVLGEESYVALRTDGILYVQGATRRYVRWERVEDVRFDAVRDALVIVRDGEPWVIGDRFAGIGNEALVERIAEVRRKIGFGLVPGGT